MLVRHGDWQAELAPETGGGMRMLRWCGRDVLRPAVAGAADVLALSCFPLLPYVNRIAGGRFVWNGQAHQLRLNAGDPRWSLHGLGWQRGWEVAHAVSDAALLTLDHAADADWPWPFHATQTVLLSDAGLSLSLSLTNHADEAVPVGLGVHPYFTRLAETRLRTSLARAWAADAAILPTQPVAANTFGDWAAGDTLERPDLIDNAFEGWSGEVLIDHGRWRVIMACAEARHFHLYVPPGADFFCAEPVTHLPDALNRPDMPAMPVLQPGQIARLTMTIGASAV